jgi:hypothetical protein
MKRSILVCVAALTLGLGACASNPAGHKGKGDANAPKASELLARSACPLRIVSAEAWRNKMPGPESVSRGRVIVAVQFDDPQAGAVVLKSPASTADTLVLELRAGESAMQGRINYRDDAPSAAYKQVVLRCRGGDIHTIATIENVY